MGKSKPVELATQTFATQAAAETFFKNMLHRSKPGDRVEDEDALHLSALLERHTEYKMKVGCGVSHFEVMKAPEGTHCFRVVRTDGSGTDFSYRHCITQRPPSRKQEVSHAFRRAVHADLQRARENFFKAHFGPDGLVACGVTGERVTRDAGHMDHRSPVTFEILVTLFLGSKGMSLEEVPLTAGQDEQTAPDITDQALSEQFRTYHKRTAKMEFVKRAVNLAQTSQHRIKPTRIPLE